MQQVPWVWPLRWYWRVALFLLFLASPLARAQAQQGGDDLTTIRLQPEDLQRGLNGHQHNFFFLPPGATGENYVDAGFFGQQLRPYLKDNEEALGQLNLYKRQKTVFLIDRLVAVGSFGLYGAEIFAHDKAQYTSPSQLVAGGVFITSLVATVFINAHTNSYLQRAVGAYNGSLRHGHGAVWPRLRPAGLEVGQARGGQPLLGLRWALR